MMQKGIVKFFNDSKGFGFIIDEESKKEIFVYRSDIHKNKKGLRTLINDQQVEYEIEEGNRGLKAINVNPL